jgi:hypothetical protein
MTVERVEETDGGKRTMEIDRDKRRWKVMQRDVTAK